MTKNLNSTRATQHYLYKYCHTCADPNKFEWLVCRDWVILAFFGCLPHDANFLCHEQRPSAPHPVAYAHCSFHLMLLYKLSASLALRNNSRTQLNGNAVMHSPAVKHGRLVTRFFLMTLRIRCATSIICL